MTTDTPTIGHNSGVTKDTRDQLKSFVERVENLEAEKKGIAGDIRDIYAEAKGKGFDVKILRKVIKLRTRDKAEIEEEKALTDLYLDALGLL